MAMGTRRRRQRQERLWISHQELAKGPGHPFYERVNKLLETERFDEFAEKQCARFYAENNGRPSLTPGIYFRLLLVGYFEGIDSERGIAWRAADSFGLRQFLGIAIDEPTPDHSTISRTRRLIDVETHRKVFFWILELLRGQGLLKGKTVARSVLACAISAASCALASRTAASACSRAACTWAACSSCKRRCNCSCVWYTSARAARMAASYSAVLAAARSRLSAARRRAPSVAS